MKMSTSGAVSRRTFIKVAGTAAAMTMGALAVGCAPQDSPALSATGEPGIVWTDETDVVVVGLGAAGAAAVVSACESGARVVALEAAEQPGGTTALSGGLIYLGGGTSVQRRLGIEDTPENLKAYLTRALGPSADPDLVEIFCNASTDLCDWLTDHGLVFEGDADTLGHVVEAAEGVCLIYSGNERSADFASIAKPAPRAHVPQGGAAAIATSLLNSVDGLADLRFQTIFEELVVNESGAVVGVKAQGPEGELLVRANRGVILATGAFTMNDGLVSSHRPEALACRGRTGSPLDMGDGLLAAQKIGAATRNLSRVTIGAHVYLYDPLSRGMLVDFRGHRILAEDWYGSFIGRAILENSPEACYILIDKSTYDAVMASPYAAGLTSITEGASIEELAQAVGLDEARVAASLERYNDFCRAGTDGDFGKSTEYLVPIEQAPFYAVSVRPQDFSSFFTLGGLKINGSAQVISLDEKPIDGLYAAGRCSCGIFGEYAGSGSSIADGLTFGRIAGERAAS